MDTPKIAVVVRSDLATWQKLNVTAFLVSGVGTARPDVVGEPYADGSGRAYLPMFGHPVLVYAGDRVAVTRAFARSRARGLTAAVFTDDLFATGNDVDNRAAVAHVATDDLFATGNDVDNRAAVAKVATEDLALAGFAVVGPRRDVDKALDKVELHP